MAQAKVTIESLRQLAEILRQSAEDILGAKEQMDNELYNIPWDDPIGLTFITKYEEDFKPLKEKLIPNINSYIQYMKNECMVVSDYSGESIGGLGVGAGAGGNSAPDNDSKVNHGNPPKKKGTTPPLTPVEEMAPDAVYAELSPEQQAIYDNMKKDILLRKEHGVFRADDIERMSNEMRGEAKYAAAVHAIRAEFAREKAIAGAEEELQKLDELAREGVRNIRNQNISK